LPSGTAPSQPSASNRPPVFYFYYINGINTPMGGMPRQPPGARSHDTCGTYICEYGLVKANLALSYATKLNPGEDDRMEPPTHNFSGKDPLFTNLAFHCGAGGMLGELACVLDNARGGNGAGIFGTGFALGDLAECFLQSVRLPAPLTNVVPVEVGRVADMIRARYAAEQADPSRQTFFIIVAHSQGNFLAEQVAYTLFHPSWGNPFDAGPRIASYRLGILSIGSPTRYETLPPLFVSLQMRHITREDDAIRLVDLFSLQGAIGKHPWGPPYAISLWPYRPGVLDGLFGSADGSKGADRAGGITAVKWLGAGLPALVTPFLNAHLLENYITAPRTATPGVLAQADQVIPQPLTNLLASRPSIYAPQGRPVLNVVQTDVRDLKRALLARAEGEREAALQAPGSFPIPQGADLGNALGDAVTGFLGH
jgi:hypothetical protein